MKRTFTLKGLVQLSGLGLATLFSTQVYSAGYKLEFQSSSILADSGEAAVVEDAGTNWYNAAGLVYLPQQLVGSLINVYAASTFSGTVNAPSSLNQLGPLASPFASNFRANGTASSHADTLLPAIHYALPLNKCWALGLSIVPAWGFTEDYGESSILRYNLTRVYTKSLDISPSVAFKINDQWSVGLGPDFHYFSAESKVHVRTQSISPDTFPFIGTFGDSISRFSADDWGYSGHVGVLFRIKDTTRVGVNYRSKIMMNLEGFSDFGLSDGFLPGGSFETSAFKLAIPLPPTTTLSLYHDMTPCWALMGTIAYDQWSVLRDYHAKNYIQPPTPTNPSGNLPNVVVQQNMHNTLDFGLGTHYKVNEKWMLRANVKYLQTPTINAFRNVNFPDGPKLGVQIGTRYQIIPSLALDVLYGHVFVRTMGIHDVNPVSNAVASGQERTSIDLIGGQFVWNI
jgi:long-chain fatty acid transport protein